MHNEKQTNNALVLLRRISTVILQDWKPFIEHFLWTRAQTIFESDTLWNIIYIKGTSVFNMVTRSTALHSFFKEQYVE